MTERAKSLTGEQEGKVDSASNLSETVCFTPEELQSFVEAVRAKTYTELAPLIYRSNDAWLREKYLKETVEFSQNRYQRLVPDSQQVFDSIDWERDNLQDKANLLRIR